MQYSFKGNGFVYIRIISAVLILIGHASDYLDIELGLFGVMTDWWRGLICLFVIFGFLIPASLERFKFWTEYIKNVFYVYIRDCGWLFGILCNCIICRKNLWVNVQNIRCHNMDYCSGFILSILYTAVDRVLWRWQPQWCLMDNFY